MKANRSLLLSILAFSLGSINALNIHPAKGLEIDGKEKAIKAVEASAYYFTPMGVMFYGADKDEKFAGDYACAPAGVWLETRAEVKGGSVLWEYPVSVDGEGNERIYSSVQEDLNFRMMQKGLYSAPRLSAMSGQTALKTYTLAKDGIRYGEMGDDNNFAVNYSPQETVGFEAEPSTLCTNSPSAAALLNLAMTPIGFSNINLLGFSESFFDCGVFYLKGICAEVESPTQLAPEDIEVKVFKRIRTSVSDEEIAHLGVESITPVKDNRYYVVFKCEEPEMVSTAMQVVVKPTASSNARISPVIPLQSAYHASNQGTASLYGDFDFMGKRAYRQYIDFYGTELEDETTGESTYLNHWNIGVLGSYEKPSAVEVLAGYDMENEKGGNSVYNLYGVKVGEADGLKNLPPGIYVSKGKKIILR